ncbi:MAG: S41 family peptidase [Anaerolineales bacterium]
MKLLVTRIVSALAVLSLAIIACATSPELVTLTPTTAPGETEEGGPQIITGSVTYTNAFFTLGVAQPLVILEDQGGFVVRDRQFIIPVESQVLGQITSDFYTSPFTYSLTLPEEPKGTLRDVDHDGKDETGVMIFAIAYWTNTWGDPYLERRDLMGGAWSSAYASTRVSDNPASYLEVFGGKYLVYAPDGGQQFPSDFGADKKLFTDDDPVMDLPAGWSVIDLDKSPFEIDRSEDPTIDLIEPESTALDDFSGLSYTEAFDEMLEKFTNEYAFTELKEIDWAAKGEEFRPRFEEAEKDNDPHAYALALRDFLWSIPDTHVGFDQSLLNQDFATETQGGLGFALRETDDGRIIANFILPGGPAEQAGMKWGAEIISVDGKPTAEVVDANVPWSSPFSLESIKRLQQLRYAIRFPMAKVQVEVTFKNPDEPEKTAALDVVGERQSFNFGSFYYGQPAVSLPVEYDVLPSGYGYLQINSFADNDVLSIQVWERALQYFNENEVPGVIIDMRYNGGGSGWLADQMAAYFFEEELVVGNTARYSKDTGEFYMDPGDEARMIPPRPALQYHGPVAVLVGPACASACEFFSYAMTVNERATIVGQYPSVGAGGSVEQFVMPEGIYTQMTIGRAVDAEGNIHLEGKGVVPAVKVPVTVETLQRQANGEDVILEAAEKALSEPKNAGVEPSGPPTIASADEAAQLLSTTEQLEAKAREQYDASDFARPGTVAYSVVLNKPEPLIWLYAWCATTQDVLEENFNNIELKFALDGEDVPLSQLATGDVPNNGQQCRIYFTALSDWPAGEHHLSTTAAFTKSINDGTADYEAGDYVLDYTVYVQE